MNIQGMSKARILMALYNNTKLISPVAKKLGHYKPEPMTLAQAEAIVSDVEANNGGRLFFDYLHGRLLKVDLSNDFVDLSLYDRDNGDGAGERIILEEMTRPAA